MGTDADVINGKVTYYAWYEMYPSGSVAITGMTVKPGDSITGSVAYNAAGNDFVLTIVDATESETFTKTFAATGEARSSAEWIVEAPSSNSGILPLANFGSATFTDAYATINGTTGAIDNSAWQSYSINLLTRSQADGLDGQPVGYRFDSPYAGMASGFTVTYAAASTGTEEQAPAREQAPGRGLLLRHRRLMVGVVGDDRVDRVGWRLGLAAA